MTRSYIVIPGGTPVLRVEASTPHFAASKARRGKAQHVTAETLVLPASGAISPSELPTVIPGQLTIHDEEAAHESVG
jgi:hypothetical protein